MVSTITITGLSDVMSLKNLDRNLRKEIGKVGFSWLKDVARTARKNAPRDTDKMRDSIKVKEEKGGKWVLSVSGREAIFQEEGFKPHFVFTKDGWFIDKNGTKVRKSRKFWADGFHWVSKNKPFIAPALEKHLGKLSQKLDTATDIAIRRKK